MLLSPSTSGNYELIKPEPYKMWVGMCVHRGVKAKVFNMMRILEKCPDPHFEFKIIEGDALIDRSRSRMATDFMKSDAEAIIFLDDDILYDPLDIRKICKLVQLKDLDIVGGAYVTKEEEAPVFAVRSLHDREDFDFGKNGEVREFRYVSSGCMAIHRRVFSSLVATETVHLCHPNGLQFYPFFCPMEKNLNGTWIYLSEDWAFCERARSLGFKVWCDTTSKIGHIGDKIYDWDDFDRKKEVRDAFLYSVRVEKQ